MGIRGSDLDAMLGRRVWLRRTLLGMSQNELAAQLSFSQQKLALLERGEGRLFASDFYVLSRVLGVPVDFFFGMVEPQSMAGGPAPSVSHPKERDPRFTSSDPEAHWRSNREIQSWVKAFLRIPPGETRSRLLALITAISSQSDANTQKSLLRNNDE